MTVTLNEPAPENQRSPWIRGIKVLLLATLVVVLYLLGLSMVHHRFFRGGRVDRFGHVRE